MDVCAVCWKHIMLKYCQKPSMIIQLIYLLVDPKFFKGLDWFNIL